MTESNLSEKDKSKEFEFSLDPEKWSLYFAILSNILNFRTLSTIMENLIKKKGRTENFFHNIIQDSKEVTMDSYIEDENYRQKMKN